MSQHPWRSHWSRTTSTPATPPIAPAKVEPEMMRVPINDEPRMLTTKEVAERLQAEPSWVNRQAAEGNMPAFRIRKRWRFDPIELADWLAAQQNELAPEAPPMRRRYADYPERPVNLEPPRNADLRGWVEHTVLAERFQVPPAAVKTWIQNGLVPGCNIQRKWLVEPAIVEEVARILDEQPHLEKLPAGGLRTGSAREAIERVMMRRRFGPMTRTPESHRRRGGGAIRWVPGPGSPTRTRHEDVE